MRIIGKAVDFLSYINGDTDEKDVTSVFLKNGINISDVEIDHTYYMIYSGKSYQVTKIV